ncbi:Eco57I restriction-modification methylase domain-containing protein [Niveispirillum sp. KHB5.9]|uniref:Eco57I restriction-modification methylase domain-containing protein n=1 Tax=Niveispirillum sp. KHB5.9 TaxID=3400269 RepID=UPI003A891837
MNYVPSHNKRSAIRHTGAVYTPSKVATAIIRCAMSDLPSRPLRVLEPSAGDGVFLGQLANLMPHHDLLAIDIDEEVVDRLRESAAYWPTSTTLHVDDFVQFACNTIEAGSPGFDLIVGNPPFIRKHNFPASFKAALKRLSEVTEYPLPDLKNSWAAFLVASAKLITDDGVVAFVLPYELITVAYGHAALNQMLKVFSCIDLFISDQKAFTEIEQDAVIFIGRRGSTNRKGLFVQRVQQMSDLTKAIEHTLSLAPDRPLALDLNAFLIDSEIMPTLRRLQSDLKKFSDLATTAPGVVTAANNFFILKDEEVESLGLQAHVLPILKKQSIINRSPIFSKLDFEELAKQEPCRLLYIKGDHDSLDQNLQAYIAEGVRAKLPQRYKCRGRKNWYEVRLVESAPGFFFKRSYGYPRICLNDAGVYITDTAYGIRPKEGYSIRGICFSFYNSLTMLFAETNGRFYGGGVLELSPNELKGLPIIYHEPTDEEFKVFVKLHKEAGNDPTVILDFGDLWLREHPAAKDIDLVGIRKAWAAVRSHRLRHSSQSKT